MKARHLILIALSSMAMFGCGQKESTSTASAGASGEVKAESAPSAAPINEAGKKAYGAVCSMCHAAGVGGAPKPGDKADWAQRLAQGKDVLYKHAIEGYTGAKGMMPARGGSTTMKDEDVKAAVDYMLDQSR